MRGWVWSLVTALLVAGCARGPDPGIAPATPPAEPAAAKVEAPGLQNVYRLTDRLYSGSSPEGDAGFRSLRELGVRTVISVDGAKPDVARARKFGLRYVHLPIGYDGVPERQGLRLARAVRDLPGPVYLHCHHGKHRGPAAAAAVLRCLDPTCSAGQAVAWLRQAGTDPHYVGLYAVPHRFGPVEVEGLAAVPDEFPETAAVTALAELMVALNEHWDHLKRARAAGWRVPPGHADIDPAHEALLLGEAYREAGRLPEVGRKPEEFRRWLAEAEEGARELQVLLRGRTVEGGVDGADAEKAYQRTGAACTRCHARYRDAPEWP